MVTKESVCCCFVLDKGIVRQRLSQLFDEGDKYWYTQEDVDRFLRRFHYDAFATDSMLPEQQGGGYV